MMKCKAGMYLEEFKLLQSRMQLVCGHEHMRLLEPGQGVLVVGVDGGGQHVQGLLVAPLLVQRHAQVALEH